MSIFRRPQVFISYRLSEASRRTELATWLEAHGIKPIFDETIQAGDTLDPEIAKLIDKADALFALGTRAYMKSDWGHKEIVHARLKGKIYLPLLIEDLLPSEIPDWFKGIGPLDRREVKWAECFGDKGWSEVIPILKKLRKGRPLDLRWRVGLILTLLFIVPLLTMEVLASILGQPGENIRRLQADVEAINAAIDAPSPRSPHLRPSRTSIDRREWRNDSGELVAIDDLTGVMVVTRHFFLNDQEFATDFIFATSAPDGSNVFRKVRRIMPPSMDEIAIEDEFDSIGTLISKRVKLSKESPWYDYEELARSVYPAIVPPLIAYR
jgi:TIR domain